MRFSLSTLAGAVALACAPSAHAQNPAPETADGRLGAVTVRDDRANGFAPNTVEAGTFRGASVMDVPATVNVVTREVLDQQAAGGLYDAVRIRAGLRDVSNVTIVSGGYKDNVVPETATATVDLRYIPGRAEAAIAAVREAVGGDIEVRATMELPAFETPFSGRLVDELQAVIAEVDPGAVVLPHLVPGGTDNKALRRLGIDGYGFIPLRLPSGFPFPRMFHGVDERVPLESLVFGEDVLARLLRRA